MGCDIHLFTERRAAAGQPWEPFVVLTECGWCDKTGKNGRGEECDWCGGTGKRPGFDDRNYDTFAQLANVRNGRAFAGCDTGDGFDPIALQRGLPEDLSPQLRALWDLERAHSNDNYDAALANLGAWPGDHSASWLTLRELLDYRARMANRKSVHRGVLSWEEYLDWRTGEMGEPSEYCSGIFGSGSVTICSKDAEELLRGSVPQDPSRVYVQVQWAVPYLSTSRRFWEVFVPELSLCGDQDNVRIVFDFDS
jgi:hypothetical protein